MEHNVNTLLGRFIANGSLMAAIIRVLPLDALRSLETELERDLAYSKQFFLVRKAAQETIDTFEWQANANLELVRKELAEREAMESTDSYLEWIHGRLDAEPEE